MPIIKTTQKFEGGFDSPSKFDPADFAKSYVTLYPRLKTQRKLRAGRPNEVRSWIQTLRRAESILMHMKRFLHLEGDDVSRALDVLKETAHALLNLEEGGRTAEVSLGHCADRLGEIFKRETGNYQWKLVGEAMAKRFPEAFRMDDGSSDVSLWAHNLAKRYRQADPARLEKAAMRNTRGSIRKRFFNPKPETLATIFPSSLKLNGAKFWPDEVKGHKRKTCSMCANRSRRAAQAR